MGRRKLIFFCLKLSSFFILVFLILFICQKEKSFFSDRDVFQKSQYLFSQQGEAFESFDLSIHNNTFLEQLAPPFLIQSRGLASFHSFERSEIEEYLVQAGDNLGSISEKFNISLETILWTNNLSSKSIIRPGQKLIILPVSGVLHTVRKGDSLSEIAETYKSKVDKIVALNQLSSRDDILIADLLIIPDGKMPLVLPAIFQIPLADSYFIYPCEGIITQGLHGYSGNAIDIANNCDKPVVAVASGTVLRAGYISTGGRRVTILHSNGVVTYYGHLSSIAVSPGQKVSSGTIIGRIGHSGYTLGPTGCHVHFEVIGARNFLGNYLIGSKLKWGD
ncbi:MAG: M23 family metallopeptidase [Candidatus Pacebacteria bacterium]|nr:M23 family metallopeptidase [Candidatus Paceibacterota bacterium]